ncbi:ABC transporter ATP-binding protein [Agaribacter flavus]|uniref:ABC transporter ATP-binding protein n=1 Tax=Agaribacter flavus TaxID=1902781 RepID=A0ABV7FQX6_9ALTE
MKSAADAINANLAINIDRVVHRYEAREQSAFFIEQWQLASAERVFLHGESGSGKTTLLNLLAGVLTPESGSIELLGQAFSSLTARQRDKFRAQHIGVVFQQFNLIPYLSVLKNIQLAAYFANEKQGNVQAFAEQLLDKLQLPKTILKQAAGTLSVGQQQRVAIARALINRPELLFVDEPTSALDASARDAFMELLIEICDASSTTLVFVSHDLYLRRFFETFVDIKSLRSSEGVTEC